MLVYFRVQVAVFWVAKPCSDAFPKGWYPTASLHGCDNSEDRNLRIQVLFTNTHTHVPFILNRIYVTLFCCSFRHDEPS